MADRRQARPCAVEKLAPLHALERDEKEARGVIASATSAARSYRAVSPSEYLAVVSTPPGFRAGSASCFFPGTHANRNHRF